jgi:hypothetical protein
MHPIDEHNPTGLPKHILAAVRSDPQPRLGDNPAAVARYIEKFIDPEAAANEAYWRKQAADAQFDLSRLKELASGLKDVLEDAVCTLIDTDHTDMNDRDGMAIAVLQFRLESARLKLCEALEAGQ